MSCVFGQSETAANTACNLKQRITCIELAVGGQEQIPSTGDLQQS